MSDPVRPHRWQPSRLRRPWDSPGTNTGVGCHFLLQCMKVKSESEVAQSCPTLRDPMDCSPPGSSDHGIFQARAREWVATAESKNGHKERHYKREMVSQTWKRISWLPKRKVERGQGQLAVSYLYTYLKTGAEGLLIVTSPTGL